METARCCIKTKVCAHCCIRKFVVEAFKICALMNKTSFKHCLQERCLEALRHGVWGFCIIFGDCIQFTGRKMTAELMKFTC